MKKALSLVLVFAFLLTLFPTAAFAAYDKELEKAINSAKAMFSIPKGYDNFTYNISKQNDKTVFNLNWNDSKNMIGSASVTIDSDGKVLNYSAYKNINSRDQKKLPSVSKSDARKIAENFIKKINPTSWNKITCQENNNPLTIADRSYSFNYIRTENGVPFPENSINVSVNGMTGEIENYNYNWYEKSVFPQPNGIISLEDAQKQFTEKLGLKLVFKLNFGEKESVPYLVYTNVYNNRFLDAKTGEVISSEAYYGYYGGRDMEKMAGDGGGNNASPQPASLTPEEQKAVENAADIMDQNKAEEAARKILNIDPAMKLNYVSLYSDWWNKDDYVWNMDFSREQKTGETTDYYNIGVSMDARSGDIVSFYRGGPYDPNSPVKYTEEQSLKIAVDTIKSLNPDKFAEVEQTTWNIPDIRPLKGEKPRDSSFTFTRKVNGAYFSENGFNVMVDNVTGTVTSYNFTWYKKNLPSTDKIITADAADKIFFDKIGVQLQYITQDPALTNNKIMPIPNDRDKWDIKLVYAAKPEKPANIDAFTGEILGYNGKSFITGNTVQYTDIKGSYAESRIKILAEYGISLPGKQLEPSRNAKQREFLYLLYKAANPYNNLDFPGNAKDDDNMYNYLIESGIVKAGEKSPESIITRQDAVKFIIRALNYGKVAEINKGIYKLPFKDVGKIKPGLYGYIAVAYGLNLINGSNGYCNPGGSLTRADAFVMVYNYLNV